MKGQGHYGILCASMLCLFVMAGGRSFVHAQTINSISPVDFGSVDFAATYNARIRLGTDGNVQISGFGMTSNGGETAGHVRITLPDTGIVEVKCVTSALLTDPTATSLTIENIEIAVTTGVAFGSGISCQGIGGGDAVTTTIDMDALPDPDIFIGGEIVISTPITLPTDHVYNTTGSGTPITLSVVVQ